MSIDKNLGIRIMLIVCLFFLVVIYSPQTQTEMGTPSTAVDSPSDLTTTSVPRIQDKFYPINSTINTSDTTIIVKEWGFAPEWGSEEPSEKAKFIWILFSTTNIIDIPLKAGDGGCFDYFFSLHYRGTQGERVYGDLNEDYFYDHGYESYPGVTREGYLLFMVPESLQEGEAVLHVGIDPHPADRMSTEGLLDRQCPECIQYQLEQRYKFRLVNATSSEDKQIAITFKNVTCDYRTHTYEVEGLIKKEEQRTEFACNHINLLLRNSRIPVYSSDTVIDISFQHPTGLELDTYGPRKLRTPITPHQEFFYSAGMDWRLVEGGDDYISIQTWGRDYQKRIGAQGETLRMVVTITEKNKNWDEDKGKWSDEIIGRSHFNLTLPRPT